MKHTLFDKFFLGFLLLFFAVFTVLIFYSTHAARQALILEKKENMINEATLIAEQSIASYINNEIDEDSLLLLTTYFGTSLKASVWFVDKYGNFISSYNYGNSLALPPNISEINQDIDITNTSTTIGDYYKTFDNEVISVSLPIKTEQGFVGAIVLHSTVSQLSTVQKSIFSIIYVPFLVMIIISFALLGIISGKILRPLRKLNNIANQYATGNFDITPDIKSKDEIGTLATSMEYMASELSKLDEYRKNFISNISHDFRSPLTSIKGYIEAMLDGTIPPDNQEKYLVIVLNETKRLTKLTSSMLELNNLDTYGLSLTIKEFNIIDVIKSTINTFEGSCQNNGITILLNNKTEHNTVNADKTKIQQVVYNLIDNAIKFTPKGKKITITVTDKNDKIFISIKDEGIGIPKENQSKIWVRFFMGDASRGKNKQSTGLGLSITKEIIKAHNENINLVSTEGVGSEFTFSLSKSDRN